MDIARASTNACCIGPKSTGEIPVKLAAAWMNKRLGSGLGLGDRGGAAKRLGLGDSGGGGISLGDGEGGLDGGGE